MNPTLKEALDKLPSKKLIRIGTSGGSNFLYAGRADMVPWDELNAKHTCWMTNKEKKEYIPFENRRLIEQYPSLRNNAELFIIEGTESPQVGEDPDLMLPEGLANADMSGIENLAAAIYKQVVSDLTTAYGKVKKYRNEYLGAVQAANKLERFIREDSLMILNDQEAIIEMTRMEVFGERLV